MRTAALLLAGGTGTRLYPASSPERPKQFLSLGGDRSLLRRTADRASFADAVYAVTRERYVDRVADVVPEATILTDPGKDTGPALVAATHEIGERETRPTSTDGVAAAAESGDTGVAGGSSSEPLAVCCLPTDHAVSGAFAPTVERAAAAAVETGGLVCVGVDPDRPATGYGYVEPAGSLDDGCAPVARFREKPDPETARGLVDRGCLWNAGIFAWTPEALGREAADSPLAPLVDALRAGDPATGFGAVPATSVDYAILERTDAAHVVSAAFEWDDLGTWDAVGRSISREATAETTSQGDTGDSVDQGDTGDSGGRGDAGESIGRGDAGESIGRGDAGDPSDARRAIGGTVDDEGNAVLGDGLVLDGSENVVATDGASVSVVGVDDLVVAAFDDRVLVVPRDRAERVRDVVDERAADVVGGEEPAGEERTDEVTEGGMPGDGTSGGSESGDGVSGSGEESGDGTD